MGWLEVGSKTRRHEGYGGGRGGTLSYESDRLVCAAVFGRQRAIRTMVLRGRMV